MRFPPRWPPVADLGIRRLSTRQPDFQEKLAELVSMEALGDAHIESAVEGILADVRSRGDLAVLEYTRRFDKFDPPNAAALELKPEDAQSALKSLQPDF